MVFWCVIIALLYLLVGLALLAWFDWYDCRWDTTRRIIAFAFFPSLLLHAFLVVAYTELGDETPPMD